METRDIPLLLIAAYYDSKKTQQERKRTFVTCYFCCNEIESETKASLGEPNLPILVCSRGILPAQKLPEDKQNKQSFRHFSYSCDRFELDFFFTILDIKVLIACLQFCYQENHLIRIFCKLLISRKIFYPMNLLRILALFGQHRT